MKNELQIESAIKAIVLDRLGDAGDGMAVMLKKDNIPLLIIASWGMGWDHVSVSVDGRIPTWDEMCWVKKLFWNKEETVIQYHPSEKDYINNHPFCLHLWKPQKQTIPQPPSILVGI